VRGFYFIYSPADTLCRFFITSLDITLQRLQEATRVCGHVPRTCFQRAVTCIEIHRHELQIDKVIARFRPPFSMIDTDKPNPADISHTVFQLHRTPGSSTLVEAHVRPVSEIAKKKIDAYVKSQSAKHRYEFYLRMRSLSPAYAGTMFEEAVHACLKTITKPERFILHSLEDESTLEINFSPDISFETFTSMAMFTTLLEKAVLEKKSCYLQPAIPNHASFDSYLYLHDMNQDLGRLFFVQTTGGREHPIAISGCMRAQTALPPKTLLKRFRPSKDHKWDIVFIVPEDTAAPFRQQRFVVPENTAAKKKKNMKDTWVSKTTQYVLRLPVQRAMGVDDS
jgi:hypothetical protein